MCLVYPERSDAVVSKAKGLSSIGPYSQLATGPMPTRVRWDDDHLRAGHSALDERECKWASGTRIHISIRNVAFVWVA